MANAGTISVDAVLNSAQFVAELQKIERRTASLEKQLTTFQRSIGDVATKLGGLVSFGLLAAGIQQLVNAADNLGDTAGKLNTTAEALQGLRLVAEDFGGSAEGMDTALQNLQRRIGEAATKGGSAAASFERLGLSASELATLSTDEVMLRVADGLSALGTNAERAALAQDIFGKASRDILGVVQENREAIEAQIDAYRRSGLILTNETVAALSLAERQLRLARTAGVNLASQFASGLVPAIVAVTTDVQRAAGALGGMQEVGAQLGSFMMVTFDIMRNGVLVLQASFFSLIGAVHAAKAAVSWGDSREQLNMIADTFAARARGALDEIRSIEQIQQRIAAALEFARTAAGTGISPAPAGAAPVGPPGQNPLTEAGRQGALDRSLDLGTEAALRQANERILGIIEAGEQQKQRAYAATAAYQVQVRTEAEQAILEMQQGAISAGIGLLQMLAARSKAAAIAMVLVNRGLAVAQAVQNTAVAITKVLAVNPYDVAGVARVKALGALQVAAIVATGIGEIANISSGNAGGIGGSTLGTPNNPVFTSGPGDPGSPFAPRVTEVYVRGVVTDQGKRVIADLVSDVVKAGDVVLFDLNSYQARELGLSPG